MWFIAAAGSVSVMGAFVAGAVVSHVLHEQEITGTAKKGGIDDVVFSTCSAVCS